MQFFHTDVVNKGVSLEIIFKCYVVFLCNFGSMIGRRILEVVGGFQIYIFKITHMLVVLKFYIHLNFATKKSK